MIRNRKKILESFICYGMLAILPVVILSLVLGDAVPLALQNVCLLPPWEEASPAALEPSRHMFEEDHATRIYPEIKYLQQSIAVGEWPLWNPQEAFGAPFLAAWRNRALSPFSIPFYLLPLEIALRLHLFLKMIIAGWCAYYAARRFGFLRPFAMFVGVSWQWSAPVFIWSSMPLSDAIVWFPLVLMCAERLTLGHTRSWSFMAVSLALTGLGGSPEAFIATLLYVFFYFIARHVRDKKHAHLPAALGTFTMSLLLTAGLLALQLIPFVEYVSQTVIQDRVDRSLLNLNHLAALIVPHGVFSAYPEQAPVAALLSGGILLLLLLPLWSVIRRVAHKVLRRRVEAIFIAALVLVCFSYTDFLFQFFRLPWPSIGPEYGLFALPLALAFLAAAAAEEWLELGPDQCRLVTAKLLKVGPVFLVTCLIVLVATGLIILPENRSVAPDVIHFLLMALLVIVLIALTLFLPRPRLMGYALAVLTCVSLLWSLYPALPHTPKALIFPETSVIQSLKSLDTRIAGSRALAEWPLAGNDIDQIHRTGHKLSLKRYDAFIDATERDPLLLRRTGASALILNREAIQGPFAPVRRDLNMLRVYPSGAVLFKDLDVLSRARVIHAGRLAKGVNADELHADQPPLLEGVRVMLPEDGPQKATPAIIENESSRNQVRVQVNTENPGILVLADSLYPGWTATINGRPAEIVAVDYIFRGVEIGRGQYEVIFSYWPMSLQIGLGITGLSLLVVLLNLRYWIPRRDGLD